MGRPCNKKGISRNKQKHLALTTTMFKKKERPRLRWRNEDAMLGIRERRMAARDHDEWKGILGETKFQR